MMTYIRKPLAMLTLAALAACTNAAGSGVTPPKAPPVPGVPPVGGGLTQQNFVGLGDSLTAGFQSDGILGDPTVTNQISALPGAIVPVTQENGWWALMYAQMHGITLNPATYNTTTLLGSPTGPLPLIKGPGLGSQIVPSTVSPPFAATQSPCNSYNDQAFSPTAWSATRLNPGAPIADLGVPSLTMHEAVSMTAPLTGPPNTSTCGYTPNPLDPTAGNLQLLVKGESQYYYPILGQFQQTLGTGHVTQLAATLSLHPKMVTVWLGANDLLDFIFSGEASPVTDSPAQFQTDLTSIVAQLRGSGATVVLADLPTVLQTPQFFQGGMPANPTLQCPLQNYFFCALLNFIPLVAPSLPPAQVEADAAGVTAGVQSTYGIDTGAYLTESGFLSAFGQIAQAIAADPLAVPPVPQLNNATCNPPTTTAVLPASGLTAECDFINDTLASDASKLNAGYNTIIDGIAGSGKGIALVPVDTLFSEFYNGTAPGQFTINPKCCTLAFGGGLVSFDGLHPSNTGYAFVANAFITAANSVSGTTPIPTLTTAQIQGIFATDPYHQ
jgi:lysophospholipase L1-like esterase